MKNQVIKKASALGFVSVGFTTADAQDYVSIFEEAISSGRIASMKWLARNPKMRCDPKALLPNARSVICLAYPYGECGIVPEEMKTNKRALSVPREPARARFARGAEYHEFIRGRLELLRQYLLELAPEATTKLCVDTSPLLEKALAQRAGIGWIGKHTILLNKKLGSWFLLGEIITDLKFKPDAPAKNLCGECSLCIDACPTRAISRAGRLDARLCISYHTTAAKEVPPPAVAKFFKKGQYGCDICQEACPYNLQTR
jgi:epoxyqueuosine reductase